MEVDPSRVGSGRDTLYHEFGFQAKRRANAWPRGKNRGTRGGQLSGRHELRDSWSGGRFTNEARLSLLDYYIYDMLAFESALVAGRAYEPIGHRRPSSAAAPTGRCPGDGPLAGRRGLWPVPITPPDDPLSPNPGKAPVGRGWGARRLSTRALFAIFRRHPGAGVGLVLGPASGVVDLEVDDREQAGPLLAELFPAGPPMTMGWNSSRGEHRLFQWDDRLGRAGSAVVHLAGGAVEFRLDRAASSSEPSPALAGRRRPAPPLERRLGDRTLPRSAHRGGRADGRRAGPRGQARACPRPRPGGTSGRYARAALEREVDRVRTAGPGTRNSTLNRAAFRLGQLVATGALDRTAVEIALTGAALAAGLGEREVERTIEVASRPVWRTRVAPGRVVDFARFGSAPGRPWASRFFALILPAVAIHFHGPPVVTAANRLDGRHVLDTPRPDLLAPGQAACLLGSMRDTSRDRAP